VRVSRFSPSGHQTNLEKTPFLDVKIWTSSYGPLSQGNSGGGFFFFGEVTSSGEGPLGLPFSSLGVFKAAKYF